jgi:hypothetical protein
VGRPVRLILTAATLIIAAAGCARNAKPPSGLARADARPVGGATAPAAAPLRPSDPTTVGRAARQPWRFAAYDGWLITTPHYRIHTTLEYDHILQRLPIFMERAIGRYTTTLADLPQPRRPLETYLFHDRRQWLAKTRQILPDEAETFDALGRGGFTTRGIAVLYYIDHNGRFRDTFAIAAHEGWHQYTQSTFRQPLPIWLEEGIATYMEGHRWGEDAPRFLPARNWERRSALRRAIQAEALIPIDDLLTRTPQSFLEESKDRLLTYYGQVWALTRFLSEGADGRYSDALAELLKDAAEGRLGRRLAASLSDATTDAPAIARRPLHSRRVALNDLGPWLVTTYFDHDLAAFEEAYIAYARQLAEGGPVRGPGGPAN